MKEDSGYEALAEGILELRETVRDAFADGVVTPCEQREVYGLTCRLTTRAELHATMCARGIRLIHGATPDHRMDTRLREARALMHRQPAPLAWERDQRRCGGKQGGEDGTPPEDAA